MRSVAPLANLTMLVSPPQAAGGIFRPAVFQHVQVPEELRGAAFHRFAYLSEGTYLDRTISEEFRYYLFEWTGFVHLTRLFARTKFGSPFRDANRCTWDLQSPLNTLHPFILHDGRVFAGGPLVTVTIAARKPRKWALVPEGSSGDQIDRARPRI